LSCFGWVRMKLDELREVHKLAERRRRELCCRQCGGSLREGQVEGLCWSCWHARGQTAQRAAQPLAHDPTHLVGVRLWPQDPVSFS
jgi:ribosomal protein L37AE/L43A